MTCIVETIGTGPSGESRERDETSVTVSPGTMPSGRACATSRTRPFVFSRPTTSAGAASRPIDTQTRPRATGETDTTPGTAASLPPIAIRVVEDAAACGRHEEMRRLGEKPALHVRLEPREERERHDERRDAEREPEKRRERDDPHLRVAPRREEIAAGEKEGDQERDLPSSISSSAASTETESRPGSTASS